MKKKVLLFLSLALVLSVNLRAQVTIGGLTTPKAGALLDLNSSTPGGLVLSNVDLTDLSVIPANTFVGISTQQDTNQELAGMIVYNTNATTGIGIHVWDGEDWIKPCAPPAPGPITFSGTSFCSAGSTFTAKIDSVKGATSYVWSLPAGLTGTSNDTIITIGWTTEGVYPAGSITVRAKSSCGAGTRRASAQAVTVGYLPAVPTNPSSATFTGGSSFTFSATPASGCTIDWYTAATGGSLVGSGNSFSETLPATTTYYAESRNTTTGCVSSSRLAVTGVAILSVSDCVTTPNVVITPANVAFVSPTETATQSGLTFSAPVKIVGLPARTTFDGGSSEPFKADYRDHSHNTNTYGSWFSWCMVAQYADVLCPSPWHVPTRYEFVTYEMAETTTLKGGVHGWLLGGFVAAKVGEEGYYWSSTPNTSFYGYHVHVYDNSFYRDSFSVRRQGMSLRCVK
jgi:hypothetical protein